MLQHNVAIAGEAIPVSNGERLRVVTYKTGNSATVFIRITQLRKDGQVIRTVERIDPNGTTLQTVTIVILTEGYLLAVDAYTSDELDPVGRIFVNVFLQYGDVFSFDTAFPLVSGYIGQLGAIRWPIDRPHNVNEGVFETESPAVTPPAAGVEFDYQEEEYFSGRIIGGFLDFTTDATVANRTVEFIFWTLGFPLIKVISRSVQAANLNRRYNLWRGPNIPTDASDQIYIPIPDFEFANTFGLTTVTQNFQAGDVFEDAVLRVQRHFTII